MLHTVFTRSRRRAGALRDSALRHEALEELIRAVAMAADGPTLRALVTRRFLSLADCRAAWFLEPDKSGQTLTVTWSEGGTSSDPSFALLTDGPLMTWLRVNETPLLFPGAMGLASYLSEQEREILEANRIGAAVPIFMVGRLRAVVMLASPDHRWALPQELGTFLMTCTRHVGLAFETIERHEAEVEQVRTVAHAQRLVVAGQFAAMVAHEVRNPLAIIRGAVQLVRDTDHGYEQRRQLLTDAIEEIDRISDTISGFLSLSRPAAVHGEMVDVCAIAAEAVRVMGTYAATRAITITTPDDLPSLRVWGDPRELRQVFLNLLLNASQAMLGTGTIDVRPDLVEEPRADGSGHRTMVMISVADTGPGIPTNLIDRIFEPFVSTKQTGTGLGLAICSQIIERHGGRMRVESTEGRGTTMFVYLPLRTNE